MTTTRQREILAAMERGKLYSVASMIRALNTGRSHLALENMNYNFSILLKKKLVEDVSTAKYRLIKITALGQRECGQPQRPCDVSLWRITPMTQPEYVPPSWGYLRNSGHVQIASRGMM